MFADACDIISPLPVVDDNGYLRFCFVLGVTQVYLPIAYLATLSFAYGSSWLLGRHTAGYHPLSNDADEDNDAAANVQFESEPPAYLRMFKPAKLALMSLCLVHTLVYGVIDNAELGMLPRINLCFWAAIIAFTAITDNHRSHPYILPALVVQFVAAILQPEFDLRGSLWLAATALTAVVSAVELEVHRKRWEAYLATRTVDDGYLPSLEYDMSAFSRWVSYSWLNPLLLLGSQKHLENSDVWELVSHDTSRYNWSTFSAHRQRTGKVALSIMLTILPTLSAQIVCGIIAAVFSFSGPFFLNRIVNFIEQRDPTTPLIQGYLLVFGLFLCTNINNAFESRAAFCGTRNGFRVRSILISEIYLKVLSRKASVGGGKITNLFGTDSSRIHVWFCWLHSLVVIPLQLTIAIGSLYLVLGWSALVGIAVMALLVPIQSYLTKQMYRRQKMVMQAIDKRMARINEMLAAIRMIKFNSWADKFYDKITEAREFELGRMRSSFIISALANAVYTSGLIIVSLVAFLSFSKLQGGNLDATTCFTAVALFKALNPTIDDLAWRISNFFETRVSYKRITRFLDGQVDLDVYLAAPLADSVLCELQAHSSHHAGGSALPSVNAAATYSSDTSSSSSSSATPSDHTTEPALGDKMAAFPAYGTFRHPSQTTLATASAPHVGFRNATLSWDVDASAGIEDEDLKPKATDTTVATDDATVAAPETPFTLRGLDVTFPQGKLTLIVGLTAAGKSSLLHGLLGEMKLESGEVFMPREQTAFVSQVAWLQNATIRDNVLFGADFDEDRYHRTLHACSLVRDLEILTGGDSTEVGEKGIVLSGGQKQRINLARSVYSTAEVVLFDDVLSALDAPTARHVFQEAILKELAGRTRILISHSVALAAAQADFIVVVRAGEIVAQGDYTAVLNQLGDSEEAKLFTTHSEMDDAQSMAQAASSAADGDASKKPASDGNAANATAKAGTAATTVELKRNGRVEFAVFKVYFEASGGYRFWSLFLLGTFMSYMARIAADNWLRVWSRQYSVDKHLDDDRDGVLDEGASAVGIASLILSVGRMVVPDVDIDFYLGVYSAIGASTVIISFLVGFYKFTGSLAASRRLHAGLLKSVLAAPVSFFDSTPTGRIQNRFSQDMSAVDSSIMNSLSAFISMLVGMFAELALIGAVVPSFIIVVPLLLWLYWQLGAYYLTSTREVKRVQSTHSSPMYSQFGETVSGATCIRAFQAETRFVKKMWRRVDDVHRGLFTQIALNRWLSQRTGFVDSLVLLTTGTAIILNLDTLDGGLAGFTLSYALMFSSAVVWLIRSYSMLEIQLNSCERVGEYMNLPKEEESSLQTALTLDDAAHQLVETSAEALISNAGRPAAPARLAVPAEWPQHGQVDFENVVCRYRADLEPVLRGVSIHVKPGQRVAICGRTGAGKSSAILALFRFIACEAGSIKIDGVDISTISLHDLRSRLTVIAQDPVCLEGTVRSNLDIFGEFDDQRLNSALDRVQVGGNLTLDSPVAENASNLSIGQRQLLQIARALLRGSRVIVLDEATASIDSQSDAAIQRSIRESPEFQSATIICIAHRIKTIIDFDSVVVLDHGCVVETGSPWELLHKGAGHFSKMCAESGDFDALMRAAEEKEDQRRSMSILA
ncbi:hypothetical protein BC828DRAFT_405762 [Blastocladiella britannica]|nr:hypothetical protein BC828DRAFT_405762 [Blastocladiella britannica]